MSEPHDAETERIRWVSDSLRALAASKWASALTSDGVDLAEACVSEAYVSAQKLGAAAASPARPGSRWRRLLKPSELASSLMTKVRGRVWSDPPRSSDFLFHAIDRTHVAQQIPIARSLERHGLKVAFVTSRPKVVELLHRQGVSATLLRAAYGTELTRRADAGAWALRLLEADPGVALTRPAWAPDADAIGMFRRCLGHLLPTAYEAVAAAKLTIEHLRPRAVLIGNDISLEGRILARVAQRLGVPSASVMHGTVHGPLNSLHVVDRLLVFGEAHRRTLEARHGVPSDRMRVTGAPYLDSAPVQTRQVRPALRRKLGIADGQRYVLMAVSNPSNLVTLEQHEATIRSVMGVSARRPEVVFVAHLHRADSADHYTRIAKQVVGQKLRVVPHGEAGYPDDILEWLQGCDALLTGASAVATEGMMLDVPVVTMDFTGAYAAVDFIRAGATVHVTSEAALNDAIGTLMRERDAATSERAHRYIDDYFHSRDRGSAERCAAVLRALTAGPGDTACVASQA